MKIFAKKLFTLFITFCLLTPICALGKKIDPLDSKEKLEYININFWENFSDPNLKQYILQALENNHSAKSASWSVEQYRQEVKKSLGRELPSISIGSNYLSTHGTFFPGIFEDLNAFILPLTAMWELDLLQKNRDRTRSADKEFRAQKWEEKGVYIALASDVGTTYLNILLYDYLIARQKNLVEINTELLKRNENRFKWGTIDALTLNKSRQALEDSKNSVNNLLKSQEKLLTLFAQLLGDAPGTEYKRGALRELEYKGIIPDEIMSDVIFARPDVMAAESRLDKAHIDIRVARKELLPRFGVYGTIVFNTVGAGNFFNWESSVAALLVGATQDIFKGGQKVAQLRENKAMYEKMFQEYKNIDLTALKEVNDALYMVKQDSTIDKNTIYKLNLQTDNFARSTNMLKQGTISRPELLIQQEQLIQLQQTQAQTKSTRIANYITLYKAVGGDL